MGNIWTLLGVLIVIVGFVLKFDTWLGCQKLALQSASMPYI